MRAGKHDLQWLRAAAATLSVVCGTKAQGPDSQQQALDAILNAADRICGVVQTQATAEGTKVAGGVQVQLSGLARHLADLRISGQEQYDSETCLGVLRPDLLVALKDSFGCKCRVFDKLSDLMLRKPSANRAAPTVAPPPGVRPDETLPKPETRSSLSEPQTVFSCSGKASGTKISIRSVLHQSGIFAGTPASYSATFDTQWVGTKISNTVIAPPAS